MSTNETSEPSAPSRYEIQKLLDTAVQPWPGASDDELDALTRSLPRKTDPLAVAVVLNRDGRVVDGSQRLRALQQRGQKYINATDVRRMDYITEANSLDWAVRLQTQRRNSGIPEKAYLVRKFMAERGWSQGRCAKAFNVSAAAISQWLGQTPDVDDQERSDYVEGADGVIQDVSAKRRQRLTQRTRPHPWSDQGECFSLVRKANSRALGAAEYPQTLDELSPEEQDAVRAIAQDMVAAGRQLLAALDRDER
ncbi:MAG TPA: hypothetical protein VFB50_12350 [Chloroflexota bacterium]|nr:hypothetical protein [Chloroflexota bacterium]